VDFAVPQNPVPSPPHKNTWPQWAVLIFSFLKDNDGNYFMLNAFHSGKMKAAHKHGIKHNRLIQFLNPVCGFPPLKLNFETEQIGLSCHVSDLYSRGVRVRISAGTPSRI
jgi:phage portal protein BeeE